MRIGHHQEEVSWEIGKLEKGISGYLPVEWLTKHNPEIDWETGVLKWRSPPMALNPMNTLDHGIWQMPRTKVFITIVAAATPFENTTFFPLPQSHQATTTSFVHPQYS
jgi:hypothetical protein